MDAITLDHLLAELQPRLLQRHLGRARAGAEDALVFELSQGEALALVASRDLAGIYLLGRADARQLTAAEPQGRSRQAALLARKHAEGARVRSIVRAAGSRTVVLAAGPVTLALRLGAPAPALTLASGDEVLATMGGGPPAWPLGQPEAAAACEWDTVAPHRLQAEAERNLARGWSPVRAWAAACPELGPSLARLLAEGVLTWEELRARLAGARPTLVTPRPLSELHDADLAARHAVRLFPFAPPGAAGHLEHPERWTEAAAAFLAARLRGLTFARRQRAVLDGSRRRLRRLLQLQARLQDDRRSLLPPDDLRRQGEALLAWAGAPAPGADSVEVPDPYQPERRLHVALDARLSLPLNATRLFEKARRMERAARHVDDRLQQVERDLAAAGEQEEQALGARDGTELELPEAAGDGARARDGARGPRRYLTSRGLALLVGRGARENQQLTFATARPDDWWLHARDVPGAHVIVRDPEGRASEADLREAAEVAAFFSDAGTAASVDVHAARRKHVRPAGAPGRVRIVQSDTLRVAPRDPEGRLRKG